MSAPIDGLLRELCPDGVPHVELTTQADYVRGLTYSKEDERADGDIRVLRANNITLSSNTLNFDDVKTVAGHVRVRDDQRLVAGDILICAGSGSRSHIGKVAFVDQDIAYSFGGFMAVVRAHESLVPRFLFHVLTSRRFADYLDGALSSSTINNLNVKLMRGFRVPVPPLEVQREIVRILDQFTALEAELEAELEARRLQYAHYRDQLLAFREAGGLRWILMSEAGVFFGGLSGKSKADFSGGNARFISYVNVLNNIEVDLNRGDFVRVAPDERQRRVARGDILFTGSSESADEAGMSSVVTSEPSEPVYVNSFTIGYRLNDPSILEPGFAKHLFRGSEMRREIVKTASGVTRFNVSRARLAKVAFPVPSLDDQRRIASILDKFDALVNDLSIGLPAELAARRAQYAHYRDRLLTFEEVAA